MFRFLADVKKAIWLSPDDDSVLAGIFASEPITSLETWTRDFLRWACVLHFSPVNTPTMYLFHARAQTGKRWNGFRG